MAERKKIIVPKRFIDKYGKNITLWSYSKLNTFQNCVHEYYLARIKKLPSEDNIYSVCGTIAHDILEDLYNSRIEYEKMVDKFEENFLDVEMSDYKFSSDTERNTSMRNKYKKCVMHFFKNHKKVNKKVATEKLIWIDVEGNIFMGYVDAIHKDDEGFYTITDYKTSSMYTGKDIDEHAKQLLLYALGLIQGGIDVNKIKVRWNFLKYTNIIYKDKISVTYEKNGKLTTSCLDKNNWIEKIKTQLKKDIKEFYSISEKEAKVMLNQCLEENSLKSLDEEIKNKYQLNIYYKTETRTDWVSKIKTQLKKDIKEFYNLEDWESEIKITECIKRNSLEDLDRVISDKYELDDCYVYADVTKENIEILKKEFVEAINKIKINGIEENNWSREDIEAKDSYYCNVLCGLKKHCRYYKEYLKTLEIKQIEEEDIINDLSFLDDLE